mgnify:FL=1
MSNLMKPFDVFDDFYRPFGSMFSQGFPTRLALDDELWMPAADVKRSGDAYLIEMEVPGFTPEDIEVEAHDNVLTIQGERKSESDTEEEGYIRRERRYGKFTRRFNLPAGSSTDGINAQVKDGVLHVTVPDSETSTAKKISVD